MKSSTLTIQSADDPLQALIASGALDEIRPEIRGWFSQPKIRGQLRSRGKFVLLPLRGNDYTADLSAVIEQESVFLGTRVIPANPEEVTQYLALERWNGHDCVSIPLRPDLVAVLWRDGTQRTLGSDCILGDDKLPTPYDEGVYALCVVVRR